MYPSENDPLRQETGRIVELAYQIQGILGAGFGEIVYKDALEHGFKQPAMKYAREKKYEITYKGHVLPHFLYADFVVFDKVVGEV
jgi:GxxExxY protein